jgi:hypothetical protein
MKTAILLMFVPILMTGCGAIYQQVYIQDAKVCGPMNHPPVYVTTDSSRVPLRISPGFSINRNFQMIGKSSESVHPYFLHWKLPDFTIGIGMDIGVSRILSFSLDWNYGSAGGYDSWNGCFGMGLHYACPSVGFRFETGLCLRSLGHDAYTVVVTETHGLFGGSSVDSSFYHDRGNDKSLDFYGLFTLNTNFRRWPVNLFVSTSILRQTFMNYDPETWSELVFVTIIPMGTSGANITCRANFLSVTPGVFFRLNDRCKLLVGGRFVTALNMDMKSNAAVTPFMQFDFSL